MSYKLKEGQREEFEAALRAGPNPALTTEEFLRNTLAHDPNVSLELTPDGHTPMPKFPALLQEREEFGRDSELNASLGHGDKSYPFH